MGQLNLCIYTDVYVIVMSRSHIITYCVECRGLEIASCSYPHAPDLGTDDRSWIVRLQATSPQWWFDATARYIYFKNIITTSRARRVQ